MPNFNGKQCQNVKNLQCLQTPCLNNGTCLIVGDNDYKCECSAGYSGHNCQIVNVCKKNSCLNQGTCITIESSTFECVCPSTHTGSLCELQNPCFDNPCKNGGTCLSLKNGLFTCSCIENYYGTNCEKYIMNTECTKNICFNGGTCIETNNFSQCKCHELYKGDRCEIFLNPCFDKNNLPVCQMNSSCSIDYQDAPYFKCYCKAGFYGIKCESRTTTKKMEKVTKKLNVNCTDKNPKSCLYYSKNKFCSDFRKVNGVSINDYCPKSCLQCDSDVIQACIDENSNCPLFYASQLCSKLPDPNVCRKSCGLC